MATVKLVGTKFQLGDCRITAGAMAIIAEHGISALGIITRHASGDWGDVDAHDRAANEHDLRTGGRLLSVYDVQGARLYVLTEADRSVTTILLPEEY